MKLYNNNIRLAKKIAIGTLISGLIFLLGYYFTYDQSLMIGGIFFGIGIFLIVLTILVSDLITANREKFSPKETSNTILWNIFTMVILVIFTIFGCKLANSSLIIVKNKSEETIKNVFITGCQNFEVGIIESKTTKMIRVDYAKNENNNCEIGIRYTTTDAMKDEILLADIKPYHGEKIVYTIE
ncbi:MAG: hypothetical protein KBS93_04030 [Flavobacteriaceae bacterium]|nr:hypothetical protein [Candidatus Onthonaster equi]